MVKNLNFNISENKTLPPFYVDINIYLYLNENVVSFYIFTMCLEITKNCFFFLNFRCISYTVRGDVGIWWIAFVLHGIGAGTVPSMWMSHSVEENLPGS